MKLTWIICVFITICEAAEIIINPLPTDPNNVNRTQSYLKENSKITQATKQNITQPRYKIHAELTVKNRLMPKIQVKDIASTDQKSSLDITTRRPLMRLRKFTSKPHAIYHIYSRTHGEQSNFSKRRNLHVKKRFKPQHKNKNIPDSSEDSISVEDRFKNFTDVGDMDTSEQNERNISTDRQPHRRRGYLATAASEQFRTVALNPSLNTTKFKLKSKPAIQESLQKIKSIRSGMKGRVITTTTIPSKVKENIENSTINNTLENTFTTSEKSVRVTMKLDKLVHLTTLSNKLDNSANTTEKTIPFTTTTDNVKSLNEKENASTISTTETLDSVLTTDLTSGEIAPTVQKLQNSVTEIKNSDDITPTTIESVRSVITIQNLDDSVIKMEIADQSTNIAANLNLSVTNTENPIHPTVKIHKLDESASNTKNFVDSTTSTTTVEKADNSITQTENPVLQTDITETTVISNSETEKSVPLIIVTAKSIYLSDLKNKIEAITGETFSSSKRPDLEINKNEENIITVTPISNAEAFITTELFENHLPQRRKRHINIIEEEKAATTSTGSRFSEREAHLDADLTYRNINT